jgi:hypothetical protein
VGTEFGVHNNKRTGWAVLGNTHAFPDENTWSSTTGFHEMREMRVFFSVIVVYIFADQVLISQNIDAIDFID